MSQHRIQSFLLCALLFAPPVIGYAAEYHGTVLCKGLPFPGAVVTAAQNKQKLVTTTDAKGVFSFPNLPDGVWNIEVAVFGFQKLVQPVVVSSEAKPIAWSLQFLPASQLLAKLGKSTPGPPSAASANGQAPARRPGNRPGGYESAAMARRENGGGFQRLEVTQSSETSEFGNEGALKPDETADLNQHAANSFLIQGSMSSALGLPQQNDWGLAARGMEMGMPGGPGGFGGGPSMGMGTPGGGPGGFGRGGPGGRGGWGHGGGFGPGAMRGPRRGWEGRPGARAFGNARRGFRNQIMGNAFLNFGNSALDARSFSVTGANVAKPAYSTLRAGIMLGGPLQIPKLVSRDRHILFSFNLSFQRNRTGTVSDAVNMPTLLERGGDFSQSSVGGVPVTIYDPSTGLPFPGNRIPAGRINATATSLLSYFPKPNLPFSARNYQTAWTGSQNAHNVNARISNVQIGSKDRLNFGIGYQGGDNAAPNLFQFVDTGANRGLNANIGWSRNITTQLINNIHFNFSRMRQLATPFFANTEDVSANLGILGTSTNPVNWGPPNLSFTNYANLTDGNYALNRNQTSSVGESLLWIRGQHNLTFGGDYRRQQFNQFTDNNGRGTFSFNGMASSLLLDGIEQRNTGYDMADFLLGLPSTGSIRFGNPDKYLRGSVYSLFANDDWRISFRFTLLAGLRWEYATPVSELYGRLVNLSLGSGYSSTTAVTPGSINPDRNNFSPRLGLAWRPSASHSLIVRAGYGIYYNTSVYNIIAGNMAQQPPFAQVLNVSRSVTDALTLNRGFLLATSSATGSTYAIDPNYRIGYAQSWNLSLQHDLPLSMIGTIGYLGTKGTRLDQQFLPNSAPPGAVESLLPHGFIYETSNGNSVYHAAQFQLNRRFHSGLMAHASYQFSKSIDDAGTGGRGQGGTPIAQNWLDLAAERGLSSFDARHSLSLLLQYSTGMGRQGGTLVNGWKGALLKDWTMSGNITVRSGSPFTAIAGGNRSQVGGTAVTNTLRANATGANVLAEGALFNTAAFALPAAGDWGNAGRNTIPGPATFTLNASFGRIFRLGERRSIDVQMQSQNLLNHVTITGWGTVLDSATYGLATNAAAMRQVSLNLRFRF